MRAMSEALRVYELTGEVPMPRDHQERIEALFRSMVIASATTFAGRVIQQGKDGGAILETKGFAETMERLALSYIGSEMIRERIASIANTTRQQIVNAVEAGYSDGLGVAEIAKSIRGRLPEFTSSRSAMIARTETHGAANFGANEAAQETGLQLRKEWISASDDRTRDDHRAADGQIVGMDEPFIVGGERLMYPGDPRGSAEQVVNCRCAMGHIVVD
jgi:uncharacterized protein with gpF-like domain